MPRGGFRPGAGRPKAGFTDRAAQRDARRIFTELFEGNLPKAKGLFKKLMDEDPARALELMVKLAEFHFPKKQRVTIDLKDVPLEEIAAELARRETEEAAKALPPQAAPPADKAALQ